MVAISIQGVDDDMRSTSRRKIQFVQWHRVSLSFAI